MSRRKRAKPGDRAIKEIDMYQKMTRTLVPRTNMERVIRELLHAIPCGENTKKRKLSPLAVDVIQELAEDYIVKRFKASQVMAIHAKRVTVQPEDWHNAAKIQTILTGHEQVADTTPINARFSKKKNRKSSVTVEEKQELSESYLQELSRIDHDLKNQNSSEDTDDSLDLCYEMEAGEDESDSSEYEDPLSM